MPGIPAQHGGSCTSRHDRGIFRAGGPDMPELLTGRRADLVLCDGLAYSLIITRELGLIRGRAGAPPRQRQGSRGCRDQARPRQVRDHG